MAYELLVGHYPFNLSSILQLPGDILSKPPDLTPLHLLQSQLLSTSAPRVEQDLSLQARDAVTHPSLVDDVSTVPTEQTARLTYFPLSTPVAPKITHAENITLASIVGKLLAKTLENRYQKAPEVIHDLYIALGQPLPPETTDIRESFLQAAKFVGRASELQTLKNALHDALAGHGSLWLVGGESGVGKTRLLNELRTYALVNGVVVVRGQGIANGGLAFQLWRDILPRLVLDIDLNDLEASILKELVPTISNLCGRTIPDAPEFTGKEGQQRLILTIRVFCDANPSRLLLLEDLPWVKKVCYPCVN